MLTPDNVPTAFYVTPAPSTTTAELHSIADSTRQLPEVAAVRLDDEPFHPDLRPDPTTPATSEPPSAPTTSEASAQPDSLVQLLEIKARNGPAGTERVTLVFDGTLPIQGTAAVASHPAPEPDHGIVYQVQGPSETITVCDSWHDYGAGAAVSTLDVLIPASWLSGRTVQPSVSPEGPGGEEYFDQLAKIIVCGPHDGWVPVTIMNPATVDPSRIAVTTNGAEIVAEITPG